MEAKVLDYETLEILGYSLSRIVVAVPFSTRYPVHDFIDNFGEKGV
jgi:hypothetical protein